MLNLFYKFLTKKSLIVLKTHHDHMDIRAREQRKENSSKKREDKGRIYDNTLKSNCGHVLCELKSFYLRLK